MESKKPVYISYTRRADHAFPALFKQYCIDNKLPWDVQYDETSLKPGRSISWFCQKLSEQPHVIFVLYLEYFTSEYCVLDELLPAYAKGAGNLLPIVVFAAGCKPSEIVAQIDKHWCEKENRPDVADKIKLALVWLLGRYDKDKNNWDILFPIYQGSYDKQTLQQVIDLLNENSKPRFTLISADKKRVNIQDQIRNIISDENFRGISGVFKDYPKKSPPEPDELEDKFDRLIKWLEEMKFRDIPAKARNLIAQGAKELAGLLVLVATNHEKLHQTIHELNRERDTATLRIKRKNDMSYQAIVSALVSTPAFYKYNKNPALKGEGELVLLERGMDGKNYYQLMEDENHWLDCYQELSRQAHANRGLFAPDDADIDSTIAGLRTRVRRDSDDYWYLDKQRVDIFKTAKFRENASEKVLELKQVESQTDDQFTAENYFISGIQSGSLNTNLIEIYAIIDELRA